jgi:serine/threonine protein phosphatase PrpC
MRIWSNTRKGVKPINEDFILHRDLGRNRHIFLVADGMGGYENGHKASEQIAINLAVFLQSQKMINARSIQIGINKANLLLRQEQNSGLEKSGATVGGVYIEESSAIIFWVGDVRVFHFCDNQLAFENKAHSLVSMLRDNGLVINSEIASAYKHVVLHSVQGDTTRSAADFQIINGLRPGIDTFVICSDGFEANDLNLNPPPKEIEERISSAIFNSQGNRDDGSIQVICY